MRTFHVKDRLDRSLRAQAPPRRTDHPPARRLPHGHHGRQPGLHHRPGSADRVDASGGRGHG
jgi:hypothetical protein